MSAKPRPAGARRPHPDATGRRRRGLLAVVVGGLAVAAFGWWLGTPDRNGGAAVSVDAGLPAEQTAAYARYAGSASCRECHAEAYTFWQESHHGLAERNLQPELDRVAFEPPRHFRHGSQETAVRLDGARPVVVSRGLTGSNETHAVTRVIGHDPLRQFLVPFPGGRFQALEAAFDPHRREWFNVYGAEDRQPGEWGHWTGRGMTWNSMCAGCHNVRVRKNYDATTDTYRTAMVEAGVGCEACHGPMRDHVEWRRAHPDPRRADPTLRPLSPPAMRDTCGTCHARRVDLTGDFAPGDAFADHQSLVIVDESDTYYADGQVRDENFELAAFLGSKMCHAGVRCEDCHEPHSAKTRLPGNWLCLRCHNGSYPNAPVIEPVSHSRHRVFGHDTNGVAQVVDLLAYDPRRIQETGGECAGCHMPVTTYMQRHPRHDHGFTIPDPLLTRELGIPNACNRCHADRTVDWAVEAVDRWYGAKMERPARQRTRILAAARDGEVPAKLPLLGLLAGETNAFWQAVAAGLLGQWTRDSRVASALIGQVNHPQALVRERVVRSLEGLAASEGSAAEAIAGRLNDPVRSVRVAAAAALRHRVDLDSRAGRELRHFLATNADQPTGQVQLGGFHFARREYATAIGHLRQALAWDPKSAPIRHELAVALSAAGQPREALEQLEAACRLAPREAEYAFKLALAWNELDRLPEAITALEQAVALEPRHARAWYNLGLARQTQGRAADALDALARAEHADPEDAMIPYARATILAQQGQRMEARAAAARALALEPEFTAARELFDQLGR